MMFRVVEDKGTRSFTALLYVIGGPVEPDPEELSAKGAIE
jgi:hypothetical protein